MKIIWWLGLTTTWGTASRAHSIRKVVNYSSKGKVCTQGALLNSVIMTSLLDLILSLQSTDVHLSVWKHHTLSGKIPRWIRFRLSEGQTCGRCWGSFLPKWLTLNSQFRSALFSSPVTLKLSSNKCCVTEMEWEDIHLTMSLHRVDAYRQAHWVGAREVTMHF